MKAIQRLLVAVGLAIWVIAPVSALEVYDDFSGKRLNPNRWDTLWLSPGAYDVHRVVKSGRLKLGLSESRKAIGVDLGR